MADVSVDVGLAEGTASALLGAAGSMLGAVEALLSADDGGAAALLQPDQLATIIDPIIAEPDAAPADSALCPTNANTKQSFLYVFFT